MSWSNNYTGTVGSIRAQVLDMQHADENVKRGINRMLSGMDQTKEAELKTYGHLQMDEKGEPLGTGNFSVIFSTK